MAIEVSKKALRYFKYTNEFTDLQLSDEQITALYENDYIELKKMVVSHYQLHHKNRTKSDMLIVPDDEIEAFLERMIWRAEEKQHDQHQIDLRDYPNE